MPTLQMGITSYYLAFVTPSFNTNHEDWHNKSYCEEPSKGIVYIHHNLLSNLYYAIPERLPRIPARNRSHLQLQRPSQPPDPNQISGYSYWNIPWVWHKEHCCQRYTQCHFNDHDIRDRQVQGADHYRLCRSHGSTTTSSNSVTTASRPARTAYTPWPNTATPAKYIGCNRASLLCSALWSFADLISFIPFTSK